MAGLGKETVFFKCDFPTLEPERQTLLLNESLPTSGKKEHLEAGCSAAEAAATVLLPCRPGEAVSCGAITVHNFFWTRTSSIRAGGAQETVQSHLNDEPLG